MKPTIQEMQEKISPSSLNRKGRREYKKRTGMWYQGLQDRSRATMREYWIQLERKSRNWVSHIWFKKVVDFITNKTNE